MYDILAYLFENCQQAELADDRERVVRKLSAAGFEDSDISEALHWLAGVLSAPRGTSRALPDARASFRAFAPRELAKLDTECRGFLITLEQSGILTPETRDLSPTDYHYPCDKVDIKYRSECYVMQTSRMADTFQPTACQDGRRPTESVAGCTCPCRDRGSHTRRRPCSRSVGTFR